MKINKYFLGVLLGISLAVSAGLIFDLDNAPAAKADSLWEMQEGRTELAGTFNESDGNVTDIRTIIVRVIAVFMTFLGIIFLSLLIYGGFLWMTAGGNEDRVKKAKSQIITAIIGFVVILSIYVIYHIVIWFLEESTIIGS